MTDPQAGATPPQNPYAAAAPIGAPGAPQYGAAQYGAAQNGAPQHNPYAATRPVRPPLTPRARTGAFIAGAVTMLMVSIGGTLIAIPLFALVIGTIIATVFTAIGGEVLEVLQDIQRFAPAGLLIGLAVGALLLGVVLVVSALFISRGILRARGLDKAWPITWAGIGIASVAGWVASGILSVPIQLTGPAFSAAGGGTGEIEAVLGLVASLAGIVVTAAIGAMSWWWMAHVMRPAGEPAAAANAAPAAPAAPTA